MGIETRSGNLPPGVHTTGLPSTTPRYRRCPRSTADDTTGGPRNLCRQTETACRNGIAARRKHQRLQLPRTGLQNLHFPGLPVGIVGLKTVGQIAGIDQHGDRDGRRIGRGRSPLDGHRVGGNVPFRRFLDARHLQSRDRRHRLAALIVQDMDTNGDHQRNGHQSENDGNGIHDSPSSIMRHSNSPDGRTIGQTRG
ncbi:hypothetical protein Acaty_c1867 [Acidithiobacillus caldus ATCC 51756]|uniref:Uncharacterized protein n=1 Tax=Acidithiobacillus caldus (strain ATCC 51756 / DSM 8584 / KU) TaxID=637389 RepID=A0A060A0F9_ACICK|nr:hypothetical protein Acaty_c1867 [Acidithiobacillus caldus ATCC 51756]